MCSIFTHIKHGIKDIGHEIKHIAKDVGHVVEDSFKIEGDIIKGGGDLLTGNMKGLKHEAKNLGKDTIGMVGSATDAVTSTIKDAFNATGVGLFLNHTKLGHDIMDVRSHIGSALYTGLDDVLKATPLGLLNTAAEHGDFGSVGKKIAGFESGLTNSLFGQPLHQMLTSKNFGDAVVGGAELASFAMPGVGGAGAAARGTEALTDAAKGGADLAKGGAEEYPKEFQGFKLDERGEIAVEGDAVAPKGWERNPITGNYYSGVAEDERRANLNNFASSADLEAATAAREKAIRVAKLDAGAASGAEGAGAEELNDNLTRLAVGKAGGADNATELAETTQAAYSSAKAALASGKLTPEQAVAAEKFLAAARDGRAGPMIVAQRGLQRSLKSPDTGSPFESSGYESTVGSS